MGTKRPITIYALLFPEHGLYGLQDKLLLFRHDQSDPNVLKLISTFTEITEGTLVEVILSGKYGARVVRSGSDSSPRTHPTLSPMPAWLMVICKSHTTMDELQIRPHVLYVHSYKSPHFCDFCGEMLFGLVRQGLKCEECGLNFHKRCAYKIPNNCNYTKRRRSSTTSNQAPFQNVPFPQSSCERQSLTVPGMMPNDRNSRSKSWSGGRPIWIEKEYAGRIKVPHTFVVHNYTRPTMCQHCKKLLKGLFRQGVQCKDCKFNCHKKCAPQIPKDCQGEVKWAAPGGLLDTCVKLSHLSYDLLTQVLPRLPNQSSNIPLMRVVQSVKHTKRTGSKIIREGWMVHYTERDGARKRHYWKLDTKAITMYQNEMSTRYFKEIQLNEIMHMEMAKVPQFTKGVPNPFVFLILTNTTKYYVGEDPSWSGQKESGLTSAESGIGLEQGLCWEHAIRQALMPVTPQPSVEVKNDSHQDQAKVKHEEKEDISQLYQIFPDDVLGSGQFGIVYGAKHRHDNREVAIKVIDKLRFPTKQEAQLKNEVAILQNLHHPGVVNLEKMFETPERIFVIMEKLKGDMLEMILSSPKGRLSERLTKFLISQVCRLYQ
ncbi:hypothetical protein LSH36_177g04119 [Paralvinella palmiformis]|uniref:protein kinase C n=1 Tax=Paralvinella palmiformis TaxID=53620 RepID=A0AAD9JSH3_9ANNE|nr:hypothetical protein LSH36_177g04119 [Paralvinella palmiformis]